ncbi:hypothetical protein A2U01_0029034 [Trifolium medium]|uniref:Uncharacterized protein n=1 Tax=Trifolium medium TaxID=97028 RepID=A0A392P851_9FABA|nr:hypothetical protein [Trifolium medium]
MNQNQIQKSYKGFERQTRIEMEKKKTKGFPNSSSSSYKKWKIVDLGRSDGGEGLGFGMGTVERD